MAIVNVLLPKYIDVRLDRFSTVLCSYKEPSVTKLFKECKDAIYKAVEFYNKRNKDKLVLKHGEFSNPKLVDSDIKIEINKLFTDGDEIPYSKCTAITLGAKNDGESSYLTLVDEAGLCDYELFNISVAPFTASTNGNTTYVGLPNNNSSSLLHRMKENKEIKVFIYDAVKGYEMRKMVDEKFAEDYKKHFDKQIAKHGKNSAFIQWNYFVNFMDTNGKFITKDILENSNILVNNINIPINESSNNKKFNIAGLDISPKKDFRVLTCGVSEYLEDGIHTDIFDIKTYNKDKKRMEHTKVAEMIARDLKMYKIDMLCVDATSHQLYFIQSLRKAILEEGINTLIIPFSYNNSTKPKLFGYLENSLFDGKLRLLKEKESWESEKLVEEMCYMIKEKGKKDSDVIKYYAPSGGDFTDDHVNSLALANICFSEAFEKYRKKEWADDGAKRWRIKLNKFKMLDEIQNIVVKNKITSMYEIPL